MSLTQRAALLGDDTALLRRRLSSLHDDLRARGYNPVQAVRELADLLLADPSALGPADVLPLTSPADVSSLVWTAFQEFLTTDLRSAFGQYLTPPTVAQHVADLLGDLSAKASVADPFLGSGILLDAVAARSPHLSLYGYEINDSVGHVGETALRLAGHSVRIVIDDVFKLWADGKLEAVDAIVTNPPFGASLVTVDNTDLCRLISPSLSAHSRVPVEVLAMELCMDRLRPGGVLVIVLPNSVLTNGRLNAFRADFFGRYGLEHVTQLSEATFAPFRGVARASVLVIRNSRPVSSPHHLTYEVSKSAGYDFTGRPDGPADLKAIAARKESGRSPCVSLLSGQVGVADNDASVQDGFLLGDIAEVFRGKNPGRDEYTKAGPFLLKVGSLSGSFISWRDRERSRVSAEFFKSSPRKQLRPGDICFTGTAHTPKYICQKVDLVTDVPTTGAMPSGEVVVVRLHEDSPISPLAMLYYLRSMEGRRRVQSLIKGSTAHVYPKDLVGLIIPDLAANVNIGLVEKLHAEAESSFRRYLAAEDEISAVLTMNLSGEDDA
jgi:type I restriction enzyme M protein